MFKLINTPQALVEVIALSICLLVGVWIGRSSRETENHVQWTLGNMQERICRIELRLNCHCPEDVNK